MRRTVADLATDLEAAYGPTLNEAERKLTIGQLMSARLSGRPEYADRVLLAPIELIVRDVDENGKIIEGKNPAK